MASYGAKLNAQGITPFWNPYMFNGMPFLADFQAQYFYPAHWIFPYFIDNATGLLHTKIIEYVIIMHFVIAQLSMVYLMRGLGASQWGALIAGISYAFSGALAVRTNHPMIIYHLALFPLIIHHVLQGLQQARILNLLYAGLILGIAILAGHAQTSTYMLLFIAVIGLIGFVQGLLHKQLHGKTAIRYAGFLALPVIIAASLAAIQYLPGQELAAYSERNDITYEKTTDGSMQLSQLLHAFNPSLHGKIVGNPGPKDADGQFTMLNTSNEPVQTHWYWDTAFYFGILALILGLISILVLPKTPLILTCQYLWIFAFLYGIGNNGFLHVLLSNIPIFGQFRNPGRMMFYASFGFPLLAGLTFDQLPRIFSDENKKKRMLIIMTVPFIILALIVFGIIQSLASVNDPLSAFAGKQAGYIMIIAIIGSFIMILRGKESMNPFISGIALCGLMFLDLTLQFKDFHGSKENPQSSYIITDELRNQLSSTFPKNIFRVSMRNQYGMAFQRNGGMNSGIMLYEGYNPILLSRRVPPLASEEDRFDILNIRYAISLDSTSGSLFFKKRESAYGHARMVFSAKVIIDDTTLKNAIMNAGSNLKNIAYMEKEPTIALSGTHPDSVKHTIKTVEYGPNQLSYEVETSMDGILCLSEIWYPAWKASIDGKEIDIHRINWSMRGIEVPSGKHTIVMTYDSKAYAIGSKITYSGLGLTILGIALGLFFQLRRKHIS
jgi:hypothetical protein